MKIDCVTTGLFQTNCYIVKGEDYLLVLDPGDHAEMIMEHLEGSPTHIVLTHAHFDHVGALKALSQNFPNAKIFAHTDENTDPQYILSTAGLYTARKMMHRGFEMPENIQRLNDGDCICTMKVLHTPGHTPGSICLLNEKEKTMFSGDTLFYRTWGRTDLGGNDEDMKKSLKKLLALNSDIIVYPGHGCITKIGEEKNYLRF